EVEDEIAQLRTRIRQAEGRREMAQSHFANIKSLSAPIRRLPPEVLSEIFQHFVTSDIIDLEPYERFCLPLRLTHICCYWRKLAMSTPSLW
ncbi:hypothetical protein JAAARDRAFT_104759, partial [Jaapia argillacea MUCL 33604]